MIVFDTASSIALAYGISGVLLVALLAHSWLNAHAVTRALKRIEQHEA